MKRNSGELQSEISTRLGQLSKKNVPSMRTLRREYSRSLKSATAQTVVGLAQLLAKRSDFGCRFLAYELLLHHREAFRSLAASQIVQLGRGLDEWGDTDCFGCYLSGPAWRDGQISDRLIHAWTRSKDRWWRRVALVSTVALSRRGNTGDVEKTLEICTLLAHDTDDMVVKALSWALREVAKKHPAHVSRFLAEHKVAPRVRREVLNKITTGLKNPRRTR